MSFEGLTRPNDFMLGYKPFSNVIYDESITPLEMLNKLAYKLNEIVASDTNVKENVDKLLGVWKEAFMAKAGYIAPIETIYSENILNPTFELTNSSEIFQHKSEKNHYIVKVEDKYKPIHLHMEEKKPVNWKVSKKVDGQWLPFFEVENASTLDADIYLATSGNSWEYNVQAQDDKYTINRKFKLSWTFGKITKLKQINCDKNDIFDRLFGTCTYHVDYDIDLSEVVNNATPITWIFAYNYHDIEDFEESEIAYGETVTIDMNAIKVTHEKYDYDNALNGAYTNYTNIPFMTSVKDSSNLILSGSFSCKMIAKYEDLQLEFNIAEQGPFGTRPIIPVKKLEQLASFKIEDQLFSIPAGAFYSVGGTQDTLTAKTRFPNNYEITFSNMDRKSTVFAFGLFNLDYFIITSLDVNETTAVITIPEQYKHVFKYEEGRYPAINLYYMYNDWVRLYSAIIIRYYLEDGEFE